MFHLILFVVSTLINLPRGCIFCWVHKYGNIITYDACIYQQYRMYFLYILSYHVSKKSLWLLTSSVWACSYFLKIFLVTWFSFCLEILEVFFQILSFSSCYVKSVGSNEIYEKLHIVPILYQAFIIALQSTGKCNTETTH